MKYDINTPLDNDAVRMLRAGDTVYLSGTVYGARDSAHKRMAGLLSAGAKLPFDIVGQVIYYVGPCPSKDGAVIGSAGPTTSGRMDAYTPELLAMGLKGMIGKGLRSREVVDAIIRYNAVYFAAVGGAGALLSQKITSADVIAFDDLGPEAVVRLTFRDFPLIVAIDSAGTDIYSTGRESFGCDR